MCRSPSTSARLAPLPAGQLGSVEPYEKRTSGAFARPGSHLLLNSGGQPRLSTGNSFTELLGPGFYDALQSGVKSPIDEVNEAVDALLDSWDLDVFQCSQEDLKAAVRDSPPPLPAAPCLPGTALLCGAPSGLGSRRPSARSAQSRATGHHEFASCRTYQFCRTPLPFPSTGVCDL